MVVVGVSRGRRGDVGGDKEIIYRIDVKAAEVMRKAYRQETRGEVCRRGIGLRFCGDKNEIFARKLGS